MPGGAEGQIGWKTEIAPGTAVVVDTFQPFRSENVKQAIEYLDTQTVSARKVLRLTKQGSKSVEGSVTTELPNTDIAELLAHMFGAVAFVAGTHTFTPDDLTGKALTLQVGRPASTGVVHAFTYSGCKIASWSLSASVGDIATLEFSVVGMTETTATGLAAASYDTAWSPYVFTEASLDVAGSPVATVKELSLEGDNAIETRIRMGSQTSREPLEIGLRTYEGSVVTDFDDLVHYNLYVAGNPVALVATFENSVGDILTFTLNVQFTGETPEVGGFDLLEQSLPFRVISGVSDSDAITVTLENGEDWYTFAVTYVLTTSTVGNGSVARNPDRSEYAEDAIVSLTAEPDAGNVVSIPLWTGDGIDGTNENDNPLSYTMPGAAATVTANFQVE